MLAYALCVLLCVCIQVCVVCMCACPFIAACIFVSVHGQKVSVQIKGEVVGHARKRLFRPHAYCVMRKAVEMKVKSRPSKNLCLCTGVFTCGYACARVCPCVHS